MLYSLYCGGSLQAVSDDHELITKKYNKFKNSGEKQLDLYEYRPIELNDSIDELDIIVNDEDKDYGYSFIWKNEEGGYSTDFWQTRLDITAGQTWDEWLECLHELGKSYGDHYINMEEAIHKSCFWWCIGTPTELPYAYKVSKQEVECLLKTGFKDDMMFLIIK